jgi:hypothetical protein
VAELEKFPWAGQAKKKAKNLVLTKIGCYSNFLLADEICQQTIEQFW